MKLLYEDKEIIVCEKPAGTASQNERGFAADMVSLLMTHEKESGVKQPYIGVVHRLDKMVGGVMVYAKNKSATANLSKQIAQHKVKKKYYAVVMGIPETQNGVMEDYLVRDGRTNTSGIAGKNEKDAKPAKLEYRVLKTKEITSGGTDITCSLLEVELFTGRHHQIRVQMASRGLPLYGDRKYNPDGKILPAYRNIGLYSHLLGFSHPVTGKWMEYQASPESGIFFEMIE